MVLPFRRQLSFFWSGKLVTPPNEAWVSISVDRCKEVLSSPHNTDSTPKGSGRTFRSRITDFLASIKNRHTGLLTKYSTGEGKISYDTTLATLQENFPHYVRELQGIADGALVPFYHLMVLHIASTYERFIFQAKTDDSSNDDPGKVTSFFGCSSVIVNMEGEILLGHTEDALKELTSNIYLVSAHIMEETPQGRWQTKEEHFTALCYAGYLPGFCMGYNRHGLVFSVNAITPLRVFSGKTICCLLCRALLAAESLEDVHNILRDEGVGVADGMAINAAFLNPNGDISFQNLEVGAAGHGERASQLSVLPVNTGNHLLHTNRYQHLQAPVVENELKWSSLLREARAVQCTPPTKRQHLLDLLSDTHHPEHPFFLTKSHFVTTTLGLFDLLKRKWTFWMDNPMTCQPLLSLPLVFSWDKE
ncbi:beta-alanyl-dopamine/carcinine hydrolase-like isoform X2 [Panulirus ornatus]|uniref:beta-alanyl-dopamine/carcinine hydrolase-like isoform X2 n=1 Tax=Panulirus ornatus TaxID=150431 RepID=UPI003A8686CF